MMGKIYPAAGPRQAVLVMRDIARHPATAAQLAFKLVQHFVADEPTPSLEAALGLVDKRADVQLALATVTSARAQLSLGKADAWPTLSLVGNYEYHEVTNFVTFGVSLPIPIFNANKTTISQSNARIVAAEAELGAARTRAAAEIRAAYVRHTAAKLVVEQLAKVTVESEGAVARAVKAYDGGISGLADVLLVRRTVADALRDKLDADLALAETRIELDAAAGRLP